MATDRSEPAGVLTCYWHPEVETGLSCSRCDKPICPQCLVQAPVGIRCRDCGKVQPMPTYDVRPTNYVRGIGVAILFSVGGGILWFIADQVLAGLGAYGTVSGMLAIPVGYLAGELISISVNRKRSILLSYVAILTVIAAFLLSRLIHLVAAPGVLFFGMWTMLFLVIGVLLAWQRLRR